MNHHTDTLVAIDLETSGLDPSTHEILQIGAWARHQIFNVYVLPTKPVMDSVAKKNGYSPELWAERNAVPLQEAMERLNAFILCLSVAEDVRFLKPVAHNAGFDRAFLDEAWKKTGVRCPRELTHRWRCSQAVFAFLMDTGTIRPRSTSLDSLCQMLGRKRAVIHCALEDAEACLSGYEVLLSLVTQPLTPGLN